MADLKHGLLLIDKEVGGTSHTVVQKARRLLQQKKIGHCGTLDPAADGLLLLTVGHATRLTRFLIKAPKVYVGQIQFGTTTDTYDAEGEITAQAPIDDLSRQAIEAAMPQFEGKIAQLPPAYSAKKVNGVKLYELARRGEEVPRESREVTVYEFVATGDLVDGRISFRLGCASGTYARSLAYDLGEVLGCGGHLASLRRTSVGPFEVSEALTLDELARRLEADEDLDGGWYPFDSIPLPFDQITADPQQQRRLQHGQTILVRDLASEEGDWVKLINQRHQFIAIGTVVERVSAAGVGIIQPKVVFA